MFCKKHCCSLKHFARVKYNLIVAFKEEGLGIGLKDDSPHEASPFIQQFISIP